MNSLERYLATLIMRSLFQILTRVAAVLALATGALLAGELERPNVLIFLVDDVGGLNDLQAYGNRHSRTPYLDRLREQGIPRATFPFTAVPATASPGSA